MCYTIYEKPITHSQIVESLSDPMLLWEAISIDGVAEPYPWGKGFYEQRQNAIQHERVEVCPEKIYAYSKWVEK